jgi:hypothetical protein
MRIGSSPLGLNVRARHISSRFKGLVHSTVGVDPVSRHDEFGGKTVASPTVATHDRYRSATSSGKWEPTTYGNSTATEAFRKTKKSAGANLLTSVFLGSPTWARTRDLRINSPVVKVFASVDCHAYTLCKSTCYELTAGKAYSRRVDCNSPKCRAAGYMVAT